MFKIKTWHFFVFFLFCTSLMGYAIYLEKVQGLVPCPLCALTRMVMIIFGILSFLSFIIKARFFRCFNGLLMFITSIAGLIVSGRHVWLQHLPPEKVPSCGLGLDYIMDTFPMMQALNMVFSGSGECAEVQWTFLSLSIPEWMLVIFSVLLVFSVLCMKRSNYSKKSSLSLGRL